MKKCSGMVAKNGKQKEPDRYDLIQFLSMLMLIGDKPYNVVERRDCFHYKILESM